MVAKFQIGDVVKHRIHPFRGVVFDVDPVFSNSEEWLMSIPEDVGGECSDYIRGLCVRAEFA